MGNHGACAEGEAEGAVHQLLPPRELLCEGLVALRKGRQLSTQLRQAGLHLGHTCNHCRHFALHQRTQSVRRADSVTATSIAAC